MRPNGRIIAVVAAMLGAVGLVLALAITGGSDGGSHRAARGTIPQPALDKLPKVTRRLIAPDSARVDLAVPSFSHPTKVTNPLFPIADLHSALLVGRFHGKPWRAETTLLPGTRTVDWAGQHVEVLRSQFVAYLDSHLYETAIDLYAQADDGAVWYLGEDAATYRDGVVVNTEGTWLAGKDGPAAMIMPGRPRVGNVYRTENVPGRVFEEVTVKKLDRTVNGPVGPVHGVMLGQELHMEGDRENKDFAPGYGEFFSGLGADYEANALAVPIDAVGEPTPPDLTAIERDADGVFAAVGTRDWKRASAALTHANGAWRRFQTGNVPRRLGAQMSEALHSASGTVRARKSRAAGLAALDVARASLDLQLRYRPPAEVDLARLDIWSRELRADARAHDAAAVRGDVNVVKLIRARLGRSARP